jgi:hypothetical protein
MLHPSHVARTICTRDATDAKAPTRSMTTARLELGPDGTTHSSTTGAALLRSANSAASFAVGDTSRERGRPGLRTGLLKSAAARCLKPSQFSGDEGGEEAAWMVFTLFKPLSHCTESAF